MKFYIESIKKKGVNKMASEIIYVCHSINNKNVREGELQVLRKYEDKLYFEFGENEINVKKRYYKDKETLNKDFDTLMKMKESKNKVKEVTKVEPKVEFKTEIKTEEPEKVVKKSNLY